MASQTELGRATEHADDLLEAAIRHPERLLDTSGGDRWKSLDQKLIDLYIEETKRQPPLKNLKTTSHLLDKLVERECLNTLVINLYPGNEGYSLLIRGRNGLDAETIRLPYEEHELLDYINAEELPPVLADLLDRAQANLFYSGNVIVELRDYRRSVNNSCDTRHVLLKPSPHTLLCDMAALTNDGHRWTQEDKFALESELLLHTSPPLCLDPTPAVFLLNKLNSQAHKLSTHSLKRNVKKYTQAAVNRKRKMAQCPAPRHLRLHDFINKKKEKPTVIKQVDTWRQRDIELACPESVEVDQFAKVLERPKPTYDNTPKLVEEYTLETERSQGKTYHTRLTISQRMCDEFFFGELYVDRDFTNGPQRGSTCKFQLGTRGNVDKYIKQFTEIITEEGRRSVKITHQLPGKQAVVTFTQIVPHFTPAQAQPDHQGLLTQATQLAASITAQSVDNQNGKRPVQLSIQINPPGGATNSQLVSPQGAAQGAAAAAAAVTTATTTTTTTTNATNAQLLAIHQQQQLVAAQFERARQIYARNQANTTTANTATTPTGKSQLPTYSQATAMVASQGAPTSATPSAAKSRRISQPGEAIGKALPQGTTVKITQGQIQSTTPTPQTPAGVQNQTDGASANPTTIAGLPPGVTSLNLTNLASLPPGISLQNLQNIPGLQVSLANVTVAGGITVPVLINSTSNLTSPTGILLNSVPGAVGARTATSTTSAATATSGGAGLASPPTLVTMVTQTTTTTSTSAGTATTTAMSTPPNIFSLPIGSITQLMATNLKNTGGIRQTAPLSLLQIPGQQPVQLVSTSLPTARTQLTTQGSLPQTAGQKDSTPVTAGLLPGTQLIGRASTMVTSPPLLQLSNPQILAFKQQQQQQQIIQLQQQQQQQQQNQQQKTSSSSSHKKKKRSSKST